MKIIAIIRITGCVDKNKEIISTLDRFRIKRKFACTIIDDSAVNKGMLKKVRSFVAYGDIDKETLTELIKVRGQAVEKDAHKGVPSAEGKIDAAKVAEKIMKDGNFKESGIKPFFRLHPPRKGINSKQHFPKGVLGDHKKKINDLIRRML